MRLTKRRRNNRPPMNMTPMIDVVFLLIIFFMTVTQVSETNREILELPKLEGSEDQKPTTLIVNVTQDGELIVSGQQISIARLVAIVEEELIRVERNPSLLTIVVRTDQRGTSRMTNEVMRTLTRLGVVKARIAVERS